MRARAFYDAQGRLNLTEPILVHHPATATRTRPPPERVEEESHMRLVLGFAALAIVFVVAVALLCGGFGEVFAGSDKGVCFDPPTYHGTVQGTGEYTTNPKDC